MTSLVSSAFIGSVQVTMTLPERSPACLNTSATRDQCTASSRASACERRAARRASPRVSLRLSGEPCQLAWAACVAEDDVVSGAREERSQLATHQP